MIKNEDELREYCLETKSFIVQAPAGSGKTELLTQRYLKLLKISNSADEILAVTFTNKAAEEMKNRIIGYLLHDSKPKNTLTKKLITEVKKEYKKRDIKLEDMVGNLKIMTIDSLNLNIVKSIPLMTRFGFDSIIDSDVEELIKEVIYDFIYKDDTSSQIHTILESLNITYYTFENFLYELVKNREFWMYDLFGKHNEFLDLDSYILNEQNLITNKLNKLFKIQINESFSLNDMKICFDEIYTSAKTIRKKIKLTTQNDEIRSKLESLVKNNELPEYELIEKEHYFLQINHNDDSKLINELKPILKSICASLKIKFNESNRVDFSEISQQAHYALKNEDGFTDISNYMGIKFSHLLIDEFQDINFNQLRLFQYLINSWGPENTIFCVGDPMQSIYRFRKSEVGIFMDVIKNGFMNFKLEHIILSTNNRSSSHIINWFNAKFSKIFNMVNDVDLGSINYQECKSPLNNIAGEVKLIPFITEKDHKSDECESELIVQNILKSKHPTIAIIARSKTHLKPIVSYIKQHYQNEIPINAIELESLYNHQCIQDILILTLAMNNFANRTYWVGLLRSPLCGITLNDTHILLNKNHEDSVWVILNSDQTNQLSADGLTRINRLIKFVKKYQKKIYLNNWHELINKLWFELGGVKTLFKKNDFNLIEKYLTILRIHGSNNIDEDKLIKEIKESMVSSYGLGEKTVSFLTIHKSKGLEFDHVIIPGLNKLNRNPAKSLINYDSSTKGSIFSILKNDSKKFSLHGYHGLKNKSKDFNELKRVLYVACTRAKSQLDLIAQVDEILTKPKKNSLIDFLWNDFKTIKPIKIKSKKALKNFGTFKPRHVQLPICEMKDDEITPEKKIKLEQFNFKKEYSNNEIITGIIIHKYLELFHAKSISLSFNLKIFLDQMIKEQNLENNNSINIIMKNVETSIDRLHNSKDGSILTKQYINDQSEYKISYQHDDQLHHYRIDRTFLINPDERWIIDYKFHNNDDNLKKIIQAYSKQLDKYADFFNEPIIRKKVYFLKQGKLLDL